MSEEVLLNGRSLKEFKVSELKAACKGRNLPIGGNKSALIKRLKAAIELENLQKAARSSPAGGSLPNSEIADDSNENDFIKQYMENQRKLLQSSTSSRFSSTSEADSEEEATTHKTGAVVSPLVGRRGRRATRDSRHSNDGEPEQIPEEGESSKAKATVKSVPDEETTKQEEVNSKPEQHPVIDEDKSAAVNEVSDGNVTVSTEADHSVTRESNSPQQPQIETEKEDSVQASDIAPNADSTADMADSTQAEAEDELKKEAAQQDIEVGDDKPKSSESISIEADDEKPQNAQSDGTEADAEKPQITQSESPLSLIHI